MLVLAVKETAEHLHFLIHAWDKLIPNAKRQQFMLFYGKGRADAWKLRQMMECWRDRRVDHYKLQKHNRSRCGVD